MVVGKIKEQKQETISHWLEDRLGVQSGNHNKFSFDSEGLGECFGQAHRRLSNSADPRTLKVHLSFFVEKEERKLRWNCRTFTLFFSRQICRREGLSSHHGVCFGKAHLPNVLRDWLSPLRHRFSFLWGSSHLLGIWLVLCPPARPSSFKDASENLPRSLAGSTRAPYCPAVLRRTAGFLITAARHDEAQIHNLWVARSIISHRRIL